MAKKLTKSDIYYLDNHALDDPEDIAAAIETSVTQIKQELKKMLPKARKLMSKKGAAISMTKEASQVGEVSKRVDVSKFHINMGNGGQKRKEV